MNFVGTSTTRYFTRDDEHDVALERSNVFTKYIRESARSDPASRHWTRANAKINVFHTFFRNHLYTQFRYLRSEQFRRVPKSSEEFRVAA